MQRNFLSVLVTLLMLFALACDKKKAAPTPTPTSADDHAGHDHSGHAHEATGMEEMAARQMEFLALALVEHRDTLDKITCHCCGETLATCYTETLQGQEGACPPT